MAKLADLEAAIDKALTQVQRAVASGMKTADGGSAQPHLEQLERELAAQRSYAAEHGSIDRTSLQATIRRVIEWVPDEELTLVAALGAIARAAPPGLS